MKLTSTKPPGNPPWLFAFLSMPAGISGWCVSALVIPYLLRKHGIAVNHIADSAAIANIPNFCFILWSPVMDLGWRRRTWVLLGSAATALFGAIAIDWTNASLAWLTVAWTLSNAAGTLPSSAAGAVMASLPARIRGRAAGWYQTGNLAIGSLAGGACIWLADRVPVATLALIAGTLMFLPALAAFFVHEIPLPHVTGMALFRDLGRDLRDLLWARRTAVFIMFLASPVGAGAIGNLISSVGPDYHASNGEVAFISGLGGSLVMGIGALAAGFVCDRMHRMTAYALFGLVAAIFAAWLALAHATPFTYGAGYSGYAFSTGLAYTAYSAVVLDALGHGRRAAASGYALLGSLGNFPVAYMTWLDGVGYKHWGAGGLMGVDALGNGVVGLALLLVARHCARKWSPREDAIAAAVPA